MLVVPENGYKSILLKDVQDFFLTRGDSTIIQFVPYIEDRKTKVQEDYVIQSGDQFIFRMQINAKTNFEKYCITDVEQNTCMLLLEHDDTINFDMRTYYYELELINIYDEHYTFISGRVTLGKEIERHG
jgi:hypothetical protein